MPRLNKTMSRNQLQYYASRFRLVWSESTIAKELGVSLATWYRYAEGQALPPFSKLGEFRDLLADICKELSRARGVDEWKVGIVDAMMSEAEPEWQEPAIKATNPDILRDMLIEMCLDQRRNSNEIFQRATKLGYSRMQVYNMAKKLRISHNHVKAGRDGYSVWSMRLSAKQKKAMGL